MPEPLRVVVAPDSFKGTLDAAAAADAIARGWSSVRPDDVVRTVPMADGGEGTMDAVAAADPAATWHVHRVPGPGGRPVDAAWVLGGDGTAVVELARTSGLPLLEVPEPVTASTLGLGRLLRHVVEQDGVRRVVVTLGGSATTDGGAGALVALGARVLGRHGDDLALGGAALSRVVEVDLSGVVPAPSGGVECLVDVDAPLLGPIGAARQFGPQKGASPEHIEELEAALARWADALGGDPETPGTGAAGGTSFGLVHGWGATMRPGAPALAELTGLVDAVAQADVVVSGEGRFDEQSLRGKVVGHALALASTRGVPLLVAAGAAATPPPPGPGAVATLVDLAGGPAAAMAEPARWLEVAGRHLAERWDPVAPTPR